MSTDLRDSLDKLVDYLYAKDLNLMGSTRFEKLTNSVENQIYRSEVHSYNIKKLQICATCTWWDEDPKKCLCPTAFPDKQINAKRKDTCFYWESECLIHAHPAQKGCQRTNALNPNYRAATTVNAPGASMRAAGVEKLLVKNKTQQRLQRLRKHKKELLDLLGNSSPSYVQKQILENIDERIEELQDGESQEV